MNYKSEEWLSEIRDDAVKAVKGAKEARIQKYHDNPNTCLFCKIPLPYDKRFNKFCSHACSATYNNYKRNGRITENNIIKPLKYCKQCGKPIDVPVGREFSSISDFCSRECRTLYHYEEYILNWKAGKESGNSPDGSIHPKIRKYLFDKYDSKCQICGWSERNKYTGNIPLEVHHIDGNYRNNNEGNLQLLCPCCHSLTKNYGSLNKGNGREERRNRRNRRVSDSA